MNILFDFISTQGYINGGGEYTLRIFEELYSRFQKDSLSFCFYCLFDNIQPVVYNDYSPEKLSERNNICNLSIREKNIVDIVEQYQIDTFFIGIGQRYSTVDFKKLKCQVFVVIHDVVFGEMEDSKLKDIFFLYNKKRLFLNYFYNPIKNKLLRREEPYNESEKRLAQNICESHNVEVITVSNFSKNAITMFYGIPENRIHTFWSPEKITHSSHLFFNSNLEAFIKSGKKYLLQLSVNREIKNLSRVLRALERYNSAAESPLYLITTGIKKSYFSWHIPFESLSNSDLENAYKNCYALMYASLHEGFGYPPLEAMKYRKPVLSSNICSLPEVLGEAPVYFSPFYVSDMVYAIKRLEKDYDKYCNQSYKRYLEVCERQKQDLKSLVSFILGK